MGKAKLQVHGLDNLIRKIEGLPPELEKQIRRHILKTANKVRNNAKARVPVRTGALKKSIRAKYEKDKLSATIGPRGKNAWYAHFVEFGTVRSRAKPFMNPAWEQERQPYLDGMKDLIREVVDDV